MRRAKAFSDGQLQQHSDKGKVLGDNVRAGIVAQWFIFCNTSILYSCVGLSSSCLTPHLSYC